jgi:DNA-binding transcriptional ArsR family regulator
MSDLTSQQKTTHQLGWEIGTAYDFFESLDVLHNPDEHGLRPSWAAGVRSRLPAADRKFLEEIQTFLWVPMHWIYTLPAPKDATSVLYALRQIPPAERMRAMTSPYEMNEYSQVFHAVADRRSWDQNDIEAIKEALGKHKDKKQYLAHVMKNLSTYLDWWSRPEEMGEAFLSALQSFYQVFFAEEEKRIAPYLQGALGRAQELAEKLSLPDLLAELSQGVHFGDQFYTPELVIAPLYWSTPLVLWDKISPDRTMLLFGARPVNASLVPGEVIPETMLRVLKALADPTRLQILRYLSEESLSSAQLSRRLRLRAPTVIHHLSALRLAGLVNLTVDGKGDKRYATRLEAISSIFSVVAEFLKGESK